MMPSAQYELILHAFPMPGIPSDLPKSHFSQPRGINGLLSLKSMVTLKAAMYSILKRTLTIPRNTL